MTNIALFVSGSQATSTDKNTSNSFMFPPALDPLPIATNSALIKISGNSSKNMTVELYINDDLIDKKSVDNNGNFVFDYQLTPGDSLIKVRNDNDNKKSDFSPIVTVSYKNAAPNLTIDSPSDGQKFSNDQRDITVSGKTDPGVTVTVNGFWAIIDQNNNYSYNLTLINGDNSIKVDATDQAGNKAEKTIKVNYSE